MLKVSIDSGRDYLDYLRPYVLQVLKDRASEIVTDSSVADRIRIEFGLEIPRRTVQVILQRFVKAHLLRKEAGVFHVIAELRTKDYTSEKQDALRRIGAITQALITFAKAAAKRELGGDGAAETLLAFLSRFSIPCLKAYLRGTALPSVKDDSDWQVVLVSQFVDEMVNTAPERFESFMQLVQGHMLANALLCPDLQSVTKSYREVTFYLDTPLLIQLLALEGEPEKQAMEELVALVNRLEGKMACFTHTLNELVNSIRASADFIDAATGRGTIVTEARRAGRSKSDLYLIAENATESLASAKIEIQTTPTYDQRTHRFEISEEVFGEVLSQEVNYYRDKAKEYDIKSVRSIYVLRRGAIPFSVERCRAVLVTSNAAFAKAAYEYGKRFEESREVSSVITDFSLANTAWLKAPQGAPSLPRKEVLAFAYAAQRPTISFWNKVILEAEKLESSGRLTARDHQLLRSSYHVQSELMKLTLGQDVALTSESITDTLERVSAEIRREETQKVLESESARLETERHLAEQISRRDATKQRVYWRCEKRAKLEALALTVLVWSAQGAVATFGVLKIREDSGWGWLIVVIAAISGTLRLVGVYWDIKPLKFVPTFIEWRKSTLLRKEFASLAIDD